jgi:hypothetical protein
VIFKTCKLESGLTDPQGLNDWEGILKYNSAGNPVTDVNWKGVLSGR